MIKKCYLCGKEYHVSIKNCEEPYICPVCDGEWKREQRKALDARRYKKEKAR
nr:MAG TPA_asm: alpha-aminoadipate carrier protein [Caudoviricetes sp.]